MRICSSKIAVQELKQGLQQLQLEISEDIVEKMALHVNLMVKWNSVCNLTAITSPREIVVKHLLDSLSISDFVQANPIIDVGSGGGFPGLPLALIYPDFEFVLLEPNAKKVQFLRHVAAVLGTSNIEVIRQRAQDLPHHGMYETVLARAVAPLSTLIEMVEHLLAANGKVLAMKGNAAQREVLELNQMFEADVVNLQVPLQNLRRHLVIVRRRENE